MRQAALYLAAGLCLILIVSLAWWTRDYLPRVSEEAVQTTTTYTVQEGDTAAAIAEAFRVAPDALAEANDKDGPTLTVRPGEILVVPEPESGIAQVWSVHLAGLAAEFFGVLLSFWLAAMAAVLPKTIRRQILGISLVLGLVSYASAQAVAVKDPVLTPQFVFASLKDGFLWSAAFPMLARLLGIREPQANDPPPEAPES
jgi:LysM repeat protein